MLPPSPHAPALTRRKIGPLRWDGAGAREAWARPSLAVAALAALTLGLALGAAARGAEPVRATAELDRPWIRIGDRLQLTLVVEAAPGYQVVDPGVPRALGELEVLETFPARLERRLDGASRTTFRYRITAFALGDHAVPPIEVAYRDANGVPGIAKTDSLLVSVKSVIADFEDPTDIKPLKPQVDLPGRLPQTLARAALVLAAVLGLALPLALGRRAVPRRREPAPPVVEPDTPARRALREVARVAELRLPAQGRLGEHYELLGGALRRYLDEQYGIAGPRRTARELLREMEDGGLDGRTIAVLHEILRDRELVRFQGKAPYPRHAEEAARRAVDVLRRAVAAEEPTIRELDTARMATR